MGQYFILVNLDKEEYITSGDIGGASKLSEWCGNLQAGIIPFLLAQGPDDGILGDGERYLKERETGEVQPHPEWGRWAKDRIVLVGDYDESKLSYKAREEFENVSETVLKEFNDFMGYDLREVKTNFLRPDMILTSQGLRKGRDAVVRR